MNQIFKKKLFIGIGITLVIAGLIVAVGIFIPRSFGVNQGVIYAVRRGVGGSDIANDLKNKGIIANTFLFDLYAFISGNKSKLQAGLYEFSPSMSIAGIVNSLASGNVVKNKITILPGWDSKDMAKYFKSKNFYSQPDFADAMKADFSGEFSFLKSKPKNVGLEGYIFPDTYTISSGLLAQDFVEAALKNFDKKLNPSLRAKIASEHKTIFQIVTMASILEKEVATPDDKKIVAGILWKRLASGVPLQVDSTINYITDKNDLSATLADIKIDSQYNTYKYAGLPLGPISNPGMESIIAAIYPTQSDYWFYLSSKTGKIIYSKTFDEHKAASAKYLRALSVR